MKITKKMIEKHNPCPDSLEWFYAQDERDSIKIIEKLIAENRLDWANWAICRLFTRKQKIQYAVYAAKQVLPIYEQEYPDDGRPRNAINVAIKCIKSPTKKNKTAAHAAASAAAYAAAYAAYAAHATSAASAAASAAAYAAYAAHATSAASAASDAAAYAAYAAHAAHAAYATAYAASDAAYDAVSAASDAKNQLKTKILKYGLQLLRGKGGQKK